MTDCSLRKHSDLSPYAAQVHKQMREQTTMKRVNYSQLQIIDDTLMHCTLMPRLHLPSDARTMSKLRNQYSHLVDSLGSSYGFNGIVASTILFNSAL